MTVPFLAGCGSVNRGYFTVTDRIECSADDLFAGKYLKIIQRLTLADGARIVITDPEKLPLYKKSGKATVVACQEGTLTLINLMERIRIAILRNPLIGDNQFECDFHEGLEDLVYPDDTYPYYMGEIISTWSLPAVKREGVRSLWE